MNGTSDNRRATAERFIESDADMENLSETDTFIYVMTIEDTDASATLSEYDVSNVNQPDEAVKATE